VTAFAAARYPQVLAAALCCGLAFANAARVGLVALALPVAAFLVAPPPLAVALAAAAVGWSWGSLRLDQLDHSVLAPRIGEAGRARVVVTGPARRGRFDVRAPGLVTRFAGEPLREQVLLELPAGRAPPTQGAVLVVLAELKQPRGPAHGFDERTWLRRRGVHVVLRVDEWRVVGRRGGLGGLADRLRRRIQTSVARGLRGDRAAVVEGVVLGDDGGLADGLRARFRAAGLYHLLAVSGQNVALVAATVLVVAWLVGVTRFVAQLGALAAITCYLLAVGAQPSVVRAGIAGALGSVAWLAARTADRWHLLLVGAAALLAWNPYTLFDAGFQLSFAAVVAIFVLVPRFQRFLEGYPLGKARAPVAVSAGCGLATAPILWLQFHSVQLLAVPANALAAPAVVPLLLLALAAAALAPISGTAALALAWLNGWCAAYLVLVARLVGGLPFAQIRSTRALLFLITGVLLTAAYACRGDERAQARLPDRRRRPAEDPARAPPPP
jgi:competence protein ComEC